MEKGTPQEIGDNSEYGFDFDLDFDFGDDFLVNPFGNCFGDTFFDQQNQMEATLAVSNVNIANEEELGLNQTESNNDLSTIVASSLTPSVPAGKPQHFPSFQNISTPFVTDQNCPELGTSDHNNVTFQNTSGGFRNTGSLVSEVMSVMARNQLKNNPHMLQPSQALFDTSVPTMHRHPQTTTGTLLQNGLYAKQSYQPKACTASITRPPQHNGFDGISTQAPHQMLRAQHGLGRAHPNQQNVLSAILEQPHQMHQANQMNLLNRSTTNNQLLQYPSSNRISNLQRENRYTNFFGRNLIGGTGSRQSLLFSNQGHGGTMVKNNYRIDQNSSALSLPQIGLFDSRLQEYNQRAHNVPTRPSVLHPQHSYPELSNAFMPHQVSMAQNADSPQDGNYSMLQLQPQLPVSSRPEQVLDHPQALQQQNLKPDDPTMITRAQGLAEDQQLFDVPILAFDSEEANILLPGSSSWPHSVEVGTPKLNDTSAVQSVVLHSWQQEKVGEAPTTGSHLADQLRAQLNAHKEKEMERRRKCAEQLSASSEPFGTVTVTYSNKRAKIDQCGSATSSYTPEEIKVQKSSALPPKRRGGQIRRGKKKSNS